MLRILYKITKWFEFNAKRHKLWAKKWKLKVEIIELNSRRTIRIDIYCEWPNLFDGKFSEWYIQSGIMDFWETLWVWVYGGWMNECVGAACVCVCIQCFQSLFQCCYPVLQFIVLRTHYWMHMRDSHLRYRVFLFRTHFRRKSIKGNRIQIVILFIYLGIDLITFLPLIEWYPANDKIYSDSIKFNWLCM